MLLRLHLALGFLLGAGGALGLLVAAPAAARGPAAALLGLSLLWGLAALLLWARPLVRLERRLRAEGAGGLPPWASLGDLLARRERQQAAAAARQRRRLDTVRRRFEHLRAHYRTFFDTTTAATERALRVLREQGVHDRRLERLLFVLHDLWELGRLPVFPPVPPEDRVDLNFLTTQAVRTGRCYLARKSLALRVEAPPRAEALEVHADIVHANKAVMNLLAHAYREAPPGTAVTVGLRRRGRWAELQVGYPGPAAPARTRLRALRHPDDGGAEVLLGAGPVLPLVEAIARHYGGQLLVRERGGRTRLVLRLPLLEGETTALEEAA